MLDMPIEAALRLCREFAEVTMQEIAVACDVPWLHVQQFLPRTLTHARRPG